MPISCYNSEQSFNKNYKCLNPVVCIVTVSFRAYINYFDTSLKCTLLIFAFWFFRLIWFSVPPFTGLELHNLNRHLLSNFRKHYRWIANGGSVDTCTSWDLNLWLPNAPINKCFMHISSDAHLYSVFMFLPFFVFFFSCFYLSPVKMSTFSFSLLSLWTGQSRSASEGRPTPETPCHTSATEASWWRTCCQAEQPSCSNTAKWEHPRWAKPSPDGAIEPFE